MTGLAPLGPDAVDDIAGLCQRSLADPPSADELAVTLFPPGRPAAVVRGDPATGVVASAREAGRGYVRLLVVHPAVRRRGHGSALLAAAEADLAGTPSVTVGTDAPDYLYPGVETAETPLLCLLERRGYERVGANLNMAVDLTRLPPDPRPPGRTLAGAGDRAELAAWTGQHYPRWTVEALRGLDRGCVLLARDGAEIAGFCAWDVNRRGWLGPVATHPRRRGRGIGAALLVGALHRMRRSGLTRAEIAWVGPLGFYAGTVGAVVSRVFLIYRKVTHGPAP